MGAQDRKKVAIVIAGCGHKDGSEITEVTSAWIALSEFGAEVSFYAPNSDFQVRDPISAQPSSERRNLLLEGARISRGRIQSLENLNVEQYDALFLPGGFGAALHLCNWAEKGHQAHVLPELKRVILGFHKQSKPIGACCIAPVILGLVLGSQKVTLTLGPEGEASQEIEKTGALHEVCPVEDYITDRDHKIVTTPAYMHKAEPYQVFTGIRKAVKELVEMA